MIVQVERKTYKFSGTVAYVVHFPGCVGVKELGKFVRLIDISSS